MALSPTGSRVLVIPDPAPTDSAGGLILPDSARRDPAMSGVVYAVGNGPSAARRIRGVMFAAFHRLVDEVAETGPDTADDLVPQIHAAIARWTCEASSMSELRPGDRVAFPYTAGQAMTVDGETYLVLTEDAIVATWTPQEHEAA